MMQDPLIGQTLANFKVERRLGQGGMAVVYLGMDIQLDRPVAIKLINAQFQGSPEYAERFVSEAKIVARWRHENIISVYYADNQDGLYYFVMEFIDGAGLDDLLRRYAEDGELMSHVDIIRIGRAAAAGLDYAHKQGVVHRDVKPANIMISRDDRVVVTDFGLALDIAQGSMGEIFGTPHYVAPEQVTHSADAVPQSDVYSMGIMFYEMLTGTLPFDDPSPTAIAMQHLTMPPPPPTELNHDLTKEVEKVLLKALAKEPAQRYQTATALVDALEEALRTVVIKSASSDSEIMLPAAITKKTTEHPRISMMSISDMLALELEGRAAEIPSATTQTPARTAAKQTAKPVPTKVKGDVHTAPRPQTIEPPAKEKSNMPVIAGIAALVVVVIIAAAFFLMNGSGDDDSDATAQALAAAGTELALTEAVTEEIAPTATDAPADTPAEVPTDAPTDAPTDVPTEAPTDDIAATAAIIAVTNDAIATQNQAILQGTENANIAATGNANAQATQNAVATENALATSNAQLEQSLTQQAQANAEPTVVFPNGRLLELTYNSAGFYLRNSSDSRVRDSRLAFVALDSNGNSVSQPFDGVDWAAFYNSIDGNGRCVVIELLDQTSWTRPTNCVAASGAQYNSQLTFPTNDSRIFWTGRNGATQFAVFWDDSEIARCQIADGFCQVRVSPS